MRNLCNHPSHGGSIDSVHDLIESLESQAFDNQLMLFGCPDSTAKILDFQRFAGFISSFFLRCHRLQFLDLFAAQLGDFTRLFQPLQTVKSSFDYILRICGTYGFREDV